MAKKTPTPPFPQTSPRVVRAGAPENRKGEFQKIGGSLSDNWNRILANLAARSLWLAHSDTETIDRQLEATVAALEGIAPRNEMEAMAAAQMIAAHNATMECIRRALLPNQTEHGWSENLNQANKLSRTYATLWEALNKARGSGRQRVTVKQVHVHAGGQAVVGNIHPGGGARLESEGQPHGSLQQLPHAHSPRCRARAWARGGKPCQSPAMANGRCRMHGGTSPGAPKGNRNAWKHGGYSAAAMASRREIAELIRAMRASTRCLC